MTQEDKEILLKDLSARLPYNVIIAPIDCGKAILIGIKDRGLLLFDTIHKKEYDKPWDIEYIKPYLRPMSSITEEEDKEYAEIVVKSQDCSLENSESATTMVNDWLLSKEFDVRGLISKGLALEAPREMYNIKEQ